MSHLRHPDAVTQPRPKSVRGWVPRAISALMKPKTKELLYHLLWHVDMLSRPTFRNLTDSYESWAYRNGFTDQLRRLESRGWLERGTQFDHAVHRLSPAGRLVALGGKDPESLWSRVWDGRWRFVVFDVPVVHGAARTRLRRHLRSCGFGFLQNSVWVSPDAVPPSLSGLGVESSAVETLIVLEAHLASRENDSQIVTCAWDHQEIDRRYARCLEVLDGFPGRFGRGNPQGRALREWGEQEFEAWRAAVEIDPMLPACLLPPGYLGRKVWRRRCEVLALAGEAARHMPKSGTGGDQAEFG